MAGKAIQEMITDQEYSDLVKQCATLILASKDLRQENADLREKLFSKSTNYDRLIVSRAYWRTRARTLEDIVMQVMKGSSHG